MKSSVRVFLCLLMVLTLFLLPQANLTEACTSTPSIRISINLNTLRVDQDGQGSLQDALYQSFYQQVKQQLGSRYSKGTLEQIAQKLVDIVLPRLDASPSQPAPEPEQQSAPDAKQERKPESEPSAPEPEQGPETPAPEPEPEPETERKTEPESDPEPEPEPRRPSFSVGPDEEKMLDLVNRERTRAGLQPLELHKELTEVARLKARDMIQNNYFAHHSPTYGSPFDMMRRFDIRFSHAGENLAGSSTVERAHQALMNSPGHRANILNRDFTHVGIGVVEGSVYGKIFVQMFMRQ